MYALKLTEEAKRNYKEIAAYVLENSGSLKTAENLLQTLRKEVFRLCDFPDIGAIPKDEILRSRGYRYMVTGEYLTFYSVNEHYREITILTVLHAKRDYLSMLK